MTASSDDALGNRLDPEVATSVTEPPTSYTYYHAGPLFTLGELRANVHLSSQIHKLSNGKYQPILPQDLEPRDTTPHTIRDEDLKALLKCDLALFTYDGSELDSGTVVEYMMAKFADIPTVILRSDFRGAGDQGEHAGDPWNLMSSNWPRTVGVVVNSMMEYKKGLGEALTSRGSAGSGDISIINEHASNHLVELTARRVVDAFDQVLTKPARLPKELRESVYTWLALMPGFKSGEDQTDTEHFLALMQQKAKRGLL